MKLVPIVALVTEETLAALNLAVDAYGEPSNLITSTMAANGWTIDAIVAGSLIKFCLIDSGVRA